MEYMTLAGCDDGNCPRVVVRIDKEAGRAIVQGDQLRPEERTALHIPKGEDAVGLPLEVLVTAYREAEGL